MSDRVRNIIETVVLTALIVGVIAASNRISRYGGTYDMFGYEVEAAHVCSVLGSIQVMLAVLLVGNKYKTGFVIALAIQIYSIIGQLMRMRIHYESSVFAAEGINVLGLVGVVITFFSVRRFKILAEYDEVTGLPNKRALQAYIRGLVNRKKPFLFTLIDMDDFKYINDTMGHEYGDALLRTIVDGWEKASEELHIRGFLSRVGGDEFVFIIEGEDLDVEYQNLRKLAGKALGNHVFELNDRDVYITGSIGVSYYPDDAVDFNALYSTADIALNEVKSVGKSSVRHYNKGMSILMTKEVVIEKVLKDALINDGVEMLYQPRFSGKDRRICGVEAEARIRDASGVYYSFNEFYPVAEKTNSINGLNKIMMRSAMGQMRRYVLADVNFRLAMEISPRYFFSPHFASDVRNALSEIGFPAHAFEIFIRQGQNQQNIEDYRDIIKDLKAIGIVVTLDGFGSESVSMDFMSSLSIDGIRLANSFVDNINEKVGDLDNNLLEGLTELGHKMGLEVSARGVKYERQLNILRNLSCDIIQGDYLGMYMVRDELNRAIR